jgi:nucleotide-binding universal stress UspA family protein
MHWYMLDEALQIARREGGKVHGLFVADSEEAVKPHETKAIAEEFRQRCESAGFGARLTAEAGNVSEIISERARFVDMILLDAVPERLGKNLRGGEFRNVVPGCSRPILLVSGPARELKRALLIYDGSPKAGTALFVVEHLAHRLGIELRIFATTEGDWATNQRTVKKAREHLEHGGIRAEVVEVGGQIVPAILQVARQSECEWIVTPGYSENPAVGDSFLDELMSMSERPILICP